MKEQALRLKSSNTLKTNFSKKQQPYIKDSIKLYMREMQHKLGQLTRWPV